VRTDGHTKEGNFFTKAPKYRQKKGRAGVGVINMP